MKKILLIANSFGEDASRYLSRIAKSCGEELKTACLYIGGCSLERHHNNMLSGEAAYELISDGERTDTMISIKDALLLDKWDIVSFQQVSQKSTDFSTYEPYLSELSAYARELAPGAKQYIHAIWAWSDERLAASELPYANSAEMTALDKAAYALAAEAISADGYLPATDAMAKLYAAIGSAAYRDGFHANLGVGRFMLGLLWYGVIFGKSVYDVDYRDFDIEVTEEEIAIAKRCAAEAIAECEFLRK